MVVVGGNFRKSCGRSEGTARQIVAGTMNAIAMPGGSSAEDKCPRIRGRIAPRLHEGKVEGCDRIELVALRD
jgi:hypothetical protein